MKAGQGHPAPAAPAPSRNRRWLAVLAAPAVVPLSRSAVFAALRARLRPDVADNAGFFLCWPGWYFAFPTWVLGEQRACDVRRRGRRPALGEAALLAIPVCGGIATELVPDRREIDARVTAVMVRSAVVNAIGEELPWRGVFTQELPDDAWKGAVWPLAGFSVWHYAPQLVLPSRLGRSGSSQARPWQAQPLPSQPGTAGACAGYWRRPPRLTPAECEQRCSACAVVSIA
jgi:Type II CAAX prenyl endopeptidase Rce1-like